MAVAAVKEKGGIVAPIAVTTVREPGTRNTIHGLVIKFAFCHPVGICAILAIEDICGIQGVFVKISAKNQIAVFVSFSDATVLAVHRVNVQEGNIWNLSPELLHLLK